MSALLSSVLGQDCPVSYEVIICDDGSSDAVHAVLRSRRDLAALDIRYIWQRDTGNRVARSRNNGIRCAQGEVLVFVDGDSVLRPYCLRDHWEAHRTDRRLVYGGRQFIGPAEQRRLLDDHASPEVVSEGDLRDLDTQRRWLSTRRPWMACITANLSVRRTHCLFFDEEFDGWASEDRDFAYRLWKSGLSVGLLNRVGVIHLGDNEVIEWHPLRGGSHSSIVSTLHNKLRLYKKYPDGAMAPSLDFVRYFHLDGSTNTWMMGERRKASSTAILAQFEKWLCAEHRARAKAESLAVGRRSACKASVW